MIQAFPQARPFLPSKLRWRLADATDEGPSPYQLPAQVVGFDGGGWWEASFGEMQAGTGLHHRALRAMALALRGGRKVEVPFLEMSPIGLPLVGTFGDGSTFSDGGHLIGSACSAELVDPVGVRDDTAYVRILTGQPLLGGDMFSLDRGETMGSELHCTEAVEEVEAGIWAVTIGPQFRAAHAAGTLVDFSTPRCAMRLRDPDGGLWPTFDRSWIGRSSAMFVEAFGTQL